MTTPVYRPRDGGPASAPTADPTQPAGTYKGQPKYLSPTDGSRAPTNANAAPASSAGTGVDLSTDALTRLGQLWAMGFGGGTTSPATQPLTADVLPVSGAPSSGMGAGGVLLLLAVAVGGWYWWKHHKKGGEAA